MFMESLFVPSAVLGLDAHLHDILIYFGMYKGDVRDR